MKNKLLTSLLFGGLLLTSCGYKSLAYGDEQYLAGDVNDLYYSVREIKDDQLSNHHTEVSVDHNFYFNGEPEEDFVWDDAHPVHEGPYTKYKEIFYYEPTKQYLLEYNYSNSNVGASSSFIGKDFGRTKCLATIDESFKEVGVLSKLYNGQLLCHASHSQALMALPSTGFNTVFPKTCNTGDYILLSLRGGSDDEQPYVASLDITFELYFEVSGQFEKREVTLKDVYANTNSGGNNVTFVGFKAEGVRLDSFEGLKGFGIHYTLNNQQIETTPSDSDNHFGLMLLEVMLPDSTWR